MNIVKGQKIWAWIDRTGIIETTVKSSGRKYITINDTCNTKFDKETLKEVRDYGIQSFLILDIEKYNQEQYYDKLKSDISKTNWDKVSEDNLDKIKEILNL